MSSEWRRGWGGAEEGQALRELAPLKCGCLLGGGCLSLRHNVKKGDVCIVDMYFDYTLRLRYD